MKPIGFFSTLLADQTRHVRHAAAEAVGEIRVTPQMVEPLVVQLSNPDKEVREAVVGALVSIGQAAVNPLIQELTSSNMKARLAAIQALVGIGPEASSAAAALVTALGDEETIRRAAIHALTRIGRGAVGPLVAALGSEDEPVRLSVLEVLGSIGREIKSEMGSILVIRALEDESSRIRLAATRALGRVRGIPALVQLGDEQEWVRRDAAKALRGETFDQAVEPILAALRDDDSVVRREIARLLGQVKDVRAVEPLIAVLKDSDPGVRCAAAEALGQLGDERAVEPLIAALGDSDSGVRAAVTQALEQLRDKRAVEPLSAALGDSDSGVRVAAAQALGQLGDERAVEPLIAALGDSDSGVHVAVTQALGQLGDERAVEPLIAILRDSDSGVRVAAAQALGQLRDERAVEPLIVALEDWTAFSVLLREVGPKRIEVIKAVAQVAALGLMESRELVDNAPSTVLETVSWEKAEYAKSKLEAAGAVVEVVEVKGKYVPGQLGGKRAVEPLIVALRDSDSGVRVAAAQALGQLGDERAVEPLIAILRDSDSGVRVAAAQALGQLGDERAVEPLIAILKDSDSGVCVAAAQALGQLGDKRAVEPLILALEDRTAFSVLLRKLGPKKIEVIKAVRQVAALGLKESKELVDSAPSTVLETVSWGKAEYAKSKLEAAGAVVEVVEVKGKDAAAEALGQLGDERAVEPLIVALGDSDSGVHVAVTQALGQLGDERAVEPLIAILRDSDSGVRVAAAQALGQLGDKRAAEPLLVALEDWTEFTVTLKEVGPKKIEVVKVVRQLTSLGLKESKDLVDGAPSTVMEAVSKEAAKDAKAQLEAVGAVVEVRGKDPVAVIRALGQLGDERAVEPVLAAPLGATIQECARQQPKR